MSKKILLLSLISLFLLSSSYLIAEEGDDPNTEAPNGEINKSYEEVEESNSWITIQWIGGAPGMDEYRWGDEDFGWTHTFDPECKEIYDVSLTIRAWDVDYAQGERDAVYADGVFLGADPATSLNAVLKSAALFLEVNFLNTLLNVSTILRIETKSYAENSKPSVYL